MTQPNEPGRPSGREALVRGLLRVWMWLQALGLGGRLLLGVGLLTWWSTPGFVIWLAVVALGVFEVWACRAFLGPRRRRVPMAMVGLGHALASTLAPAAMLIWIMSTGDFAFIEVAIPGIGLLLGIGWAVGWGLIVRRIMGWGGGSPAPEAPPRAA